MELAGRVAPAPHRARPPPPSPLPTARVAFWETHRTPKDRGARGYRVQVRLSLAPPPPPRPVLMRSMRSKGMPAARCPVDPVPGACTCRYCGVSYLVFSEVKALEKRTLAAEQAMASWKVPARPACLCCWLAHVTSAERWFPLQLRRF
jgi:hypothetical protein